MSSRYMQSKDLSVEDSLVVHSKVITVCRASLRLIWPDRCVCVREVREQRHRTADRDDYVLSKLFTDATTDRPLPTI